MTMTDDLPAMDEELQRFVDGELPRSRYLEIAALVEKDEAVARRVREYREINRLLAGFNLDVLSEPVPERLRGPHGRRSRGPMYRIAASAALVTLGILIGTQLGPWRSGPSAAAPAQVVQSAAAAHEVYAVEILHPVEVGGDDAEHLERWLGKRLHHPFRIPRIEVHGYRLLGGRLLPGDATSPHALLMYERDDGVRLSLYLARSQHDREHTPLLFDKTRGMGIYSWVDDDLSCAVVATLDDRLDRDELHRLSDSIYQMLEL